MLTNKHLKELRSSPYCPESRNRLFVEPLPTIDILNKRSVLNKQQIKINKILRSDSESDDYDSSSTESDDDYFNSSTTGSGSNGVSLIDRASSFFSSASTTLTMQFGNGEFREGDAFQESSARSDNGSSLFSGSRGK